MIHMKCQTYFSLGKKTKECLLLQIWLSALRVNLGTLILGDDIAWMRFDKEGQLRGINPEAGFFGVCPGTSMKTNPNAMLACRKNTIFTNTAEMSDGAVYWEGLDDEVDTVCIYMFSASTLGTKS